MSNSQLSLKEMQESGRQKIEWARSHMPVLNQIRADFEKEKPLAGHKIAMALHVEAKTAVLVKRSQPEAQKLQSPDAIRSARKMMSPPL